VHIALPNMLFTSWCGSTW